MSEARTSLSAAIRAPAASSASAAAFLFAFGVLLGGIATFQRFSALFCAFLRFSALFCAFLNCVVIFLRNNF